MALTLHRQSAVESVFIIPKSWLDRKIADFPWWTHVWVDCRTCGAPVISWKEIK